MAGAPTRQNDDRQKEKSFKIDAFRQGNNDSPQCMHYGFDDGECCQETREEGSTLMHVNMKCNRMTVGDVSI